MEESISRWYHPSKETVDRRRRTVEGSRRQPAPPRPPVEHVFDIDCLFAATASWAGAASVMGSSPSARARSVGHLGLGEVGHCLKM